MEDFYLYPGTNILKNKLNILDENELKNAESDLVSFRLTEISRQPLRGDYSFQHFLSMHYYIFQDIYDWAGQIRKLNIYKEEAILGRMSIEYSDVFDIAKDATRILKTLHTDKWDELTSKDIVQKFCFVMADLWKVHCFREGNTRTTIHFFCQYADERIRKINRKIFEENSGYVRTALVAYNAFFSDGTNYSKKHYLEDIVSDAFGWR